jgi:hypothetical protein
VCRSCGARFYCGTEFAQIQRGTRLSVWDSNGGVGRSLAPPSRPNPQQYRGRRAREQATEWYDAARDFANVLSFDKCKPGQVVRGKIAKDVPLRNGSVIRKGSDVEGHIVEMTPAANGSGANVAMQFDKLDVGGRKVPVVTNLQAIADNPPALWAFNVDVRGNYGIDNLLIAHAGNTHPVGKIVLASQAQNLKLDKGDALLLLVD